MKTFINPNKIIKAEIMEPEEGYVCDILGFQPGHGWQLDLSLDGDMRCVLECESEAVCIAFCNSFNLMGIE